MKKINIQTALEQGYTYFTVEDTEHFYRIGEITDLPKGRLLLLDKDKLPFNISRNDLIGLLEDHILNQEEFYEEGDSLIDELHKADFDKITELVNVGFKPRFMFPAGIELILGE